MDDIQTIREALAAGLDCAVAERNQIEAELGHQMPHRVRRAQDDVIVADAAVGAFARLLARLEEAERQVALLEELATATLISYTFGARL